VDDPLRDDVAAWAMAGVPLPQIVGGNSVQLLRGGDALFPAMCEAIGRAREEVWLATYIFHDDRSAEGVARALMAAAARGVRVHVVVDGFGSKSTLDSVSQWFSLPGVRLAVFRPLRRWYSWLQPGQLRRLHQKLCTVDGDVGFVGGINIIDDRHDLNHGWTDAPRLDFAVQVSGPLVASVRQATRAVWARAHLGRAWRDEVRSLARSVAPVDETLRLIRGWRHRHDDVAEPEPEPLTPMRAALLVRDNLRQRRAIERSYVEAIRSARERLDIAVPYFYPGRVFRRALRHAARRGVRVRLLLQGKIDYRIAALAARALYDELRLHGVHIYEYTPAFLHAKVALVDGRWATVGSSNIDPLSLLLNLEANIVVDDPGFADSLGRSLDEAFAVSIEVLGRPTQGGWRGMLHRGVVAWMANVYLRLAGITGRY
jgi:cardiolipin synthase A/B